MVTHLDLTGRRQCGDSPMANIKTLAERLQLMDSGTRRVVLNWMNLLTECGYDVPTAKHLMTMPQRRAKATPAAAEGNQP